MKYYKRIITIIMLCFVMTIQFGVIHNANAAEDTEGINVEYHTQEEIKSYIASSGAMSTDPVTYTKNPTLTGKYNQGSLSPETLESAVKMLNQIRYIAGLSYDITLNQEYTKLAQAATLVNGVNGVLSHFPAQPSNMSEELYKLGYSGASQSNLSAGYSTLNASLLYGWMSDADNSNIDRVGHRRWVLNPYMGQTGFGALTNSGTSYGNWYAMYAFDYTGNADQYGVVWPAQNMPTEYFKANDPWSISMGSSVEISDIKVSLTRLSDNKSWEFSNSKKDGYFNVNNAGYGQSGCIIFRPEGVNEYCNNDSYRVVITGLDQPVSYTINFFDLYPVESVTLDQTKLKMELGEWKSLEGTVLPKNASNQTLKWESSDPSIIEVTDYGTLHALAYGTVKITVSSISGNKSTSCTVTVSKPITELAVEEITSRKYTGEALKPKIIIKDNEAVLKLNTDYTVSYTNNIKAGTATVTIKGQGQYEGTRKIKFQITAKLKLNKSKVTLSKTQNTFDLAVTSKEKADAVTSWKSSNPKCVKVDKNGKITGVSAGTATITVTMESGMTAACVVTVKK